jgi:hypothetical protein
MAEIIRLVLVQAAAKIVYHFFVSIILTEMETNNALNYVRIRPVFVTEKEVQEGAYFSDG